MRAPYFVPGGRRSIQEPDTVRSKTHSPEASYCQFTDMLVRGCLHSAEITLRAQCVRERARNFDLLQASFEDDAVRLLEICLQDDVEFVQRSKDFFDANYIGPVMEISEAGADIVAPRSLAFSVACDPRVYFDSIAKGHANKSMARTRPTSTGSYNSDASEWWRGCRRSPERLRSVCEQTSGAEGGPLLTVQQPSFSV